MTEQAPARKLLHESERSYKLPNHDFGNLTGITRHQEQRACITAADNAHNPEDATLLLTMLGVWPDKEYQEKLRTERK